MVTVTKGSTEVDATTAKGMYQLAEAGIAFYKKAEPTADLTAAIGHLRNSRNWQAAKHYTAAYRDAQRAVEATNEAVCFAVRERFGLEVGPLRTNISEARRIYGPDPELTRLEEQLQDLERKLNNLRPAVIYYCSREIFIRIPLITSRFTRCLNILRLGQIQRERFEAKVASVYERIGKLRETYPRARHVELQRVEEELTALQNAFHRGGYLSDAQLSIRRVDSLTVRVEEYASRMSEAFRPPSEKNVPQRDRPRVAKRRSHGPGRYSH